MALTKIQSLGITDGTIVNADINASAAIAGTKLSAGTVLQVVSAIYTTEKTTTSTSFVTTDASASITPSSTSNKILVLVNGTAENTSGSYHGEFTLYRSSTNLDTKGSGMIQVWSSAGYWRGSMAMNKLDSPSTTSSVTYTVYFRATNAGTTVKFSQTDSIITLLEIKG